MPWNVFDFLLVLASILGILMEDIMIDLPISPTLLRVVRVFRIGRILRLIKVSIILNYRCCLSVFIMDYFVSKNRVLHVFRPLRALGNSCSR